MRSIVALTTLCLAVVSVGIAQQPEPKSPLPPPNQTPQLVINHAGPHAPIQSLAFAPDGTLYAGGYGKIVHRYVLKNGQYQPAEPIRVPLGPGNAGAVNAVAVSPDGKWVAVAGRAPLRGENWTGSDDGIVVKTQYFPTQMKQDYGLVYLFNPADPLGGKVIRGPEAGVRSLAFANPAPVDGPVLVTTSVEWDKDDKKFGVVRVFDGTSGKEIAVRKDLPATATRPGLAAWASGKTLQVAVAWPGAANKLLVWDTSSNRDDWFDDGTGNRALAVRAGKTGAEQVISGGLTKAFGQLMLRPVADPKQGQSVRLGGAGQYLLPLAVTPVGDATAAVVLDLPPQGVARAATTELWLVDAAGQPSVRVGLKGGDIAAVPPVAGSADGKWIAVGGFTDNRIEVYDAAAFAQRQVVIQTLAAAPGGYTKVAFLSGGRLWLGGATDTAPRGGVVFDPEGRKVVGGGDGQQIDVSPGGGPVNWNEVSNDGVVTLTVAAAGAVKFTLLNDEKPTAAVFLPAGPAWDKELKAVLAVAHYNPKAAVSLVTLFDATDGRRLMQLSGPTLRIDGLAFSGSRPLLAAVGADRVASAWSLKNLRNPLPAVEGVTLYERGEELVVGSVEPTSPARDVLKAEAVIQAVGGEKGELKAVKTYREFLLAVKEIGLGNTARVRLKGAAAAVAVPVGRGVGHRHPLFDLWVNPVANRGGSHDWIGWNAAGPYDANSLAAEARLGWLNATGNSAEPIRYARADQYRRQYHKADLLRLLVEEADFDAALNRHIALFPRTRPTLLVRAEGAEERDGRLILRSRPAGLGVRLNDPSQVLLLDKAVLRWRAVEPDGKAGEWQTQPLTTLRTMIPLADAGWSRGLRRFEAEVRETPDEPAVVETAAAFVLVPPAPVLTVRVNGEKVVPGQKLSSEKESVVVSAEVKGAVGEEVNVSLGSSGPDGGTAVKLPAGKAVSVRLQREAQTTIRVSAVNAAAGGDKELETDAVNVTVWHTPKPPKPAPQVRMSVTTAVDPPLAPGEPFVSESSTIRLSAAVIADKVQKLEWDEGDGKWVEAEYKPADPKAPTVTRDVTIGEGGKPRTLRVRVTADDGASKVDQTSVLWAGLPAVDFTDPPEAVPVAELTTRGTVRAPKGISSYELSVIVESADEPRRVVNVTPFGEGWQATVLLAPGDNRLSLEVSNKWKRSKVAAREVRFIRPPVVVAALPITVGPDGLGDVVAVVSAPAALPPHRLIIAGHPTSAKPFLGPLTFSGLTLWWVKAEAVRLKTNGILPRSVRVAVGNADGDSSPVEAAVAKKAVPPPPPPQLTVTGGPSRADLANGENVRTDQPRFAIGVKVNSATKLTRVELRRADAIDGQSDRLPGVDVGTAVGGPNGFALEANPTLPLREGLNQFEVVAVAGEARDSFRFSVSYTPPPIRVVIDSIDETGASGATTTLTTTGGAYRADGGFVLVRGRVIWSGTGEAVRGTGHEVVLVANEVRHLPVELAKPSADSREARFVAPLFLNANDTQVRVEVRARGRIDGVAQQKVADVAAAVHSDRPIRQQRLHVLVIAPLVPDDQRATLAREVIRAVGGDLPADRPVFHRMPFKHKAFVRATLYSPLVHNVSKPGVVGLLQDVEDEISRPADDPGPKGWVNDVVLVYYQGRDQMGKDGLLRLHTTRSITYLDRGGEQFAVRMDELPPTPGVRLQLLNIMDPDGRPQPAEHLSAVPLLLRYSWKDQASVGELLPLFREAASAQKPTVGGVVDWVGKQMEKKTDRSYQPTITLPSVVRDRRLGDGGS